MVAKDPAASQGPGKRQTPPHLHSQTALSWPQALKNFSCATTENGIPLSINILLSLSVLSESKATMTATSRFKLF
jgi:hypothetical protein